MRHVTLAARRARQYLRRPPPPRWVRPAVHLLTFLGVAVFAVGAGTWAVRSGAIERTRQALLDRAFGLTASAGLELREVYVEGRARTGRKEVLQGLGVELGQPILALDTGALRTRLEELPWVEQASVSRMLPDVLRVRLVERRPLALWQHDGRFDVIDRTGTVIDAKVRPDLPVVVGEGAPRHAAELIAVLSSEPELWQRVVAASRVGDRRWTLHLDNGIEVLLPERDPSDAWRFLADVTREQALLERAITVIDLRFPPDRLRLRLDPAVFEDQGA